MPYRGLLRITSKPECAQQGRTSGRPFHMPSQGAGINPAMRFLTTRCRQPISSPVECGSSCNKRHIDQSFTDRLFATGLRYCRPIPCHELVIDEFLELAVSDLIQEEEVLQRDERISHIRL